MWRKAVRAVLLRPGRRPADAAGVATLGALVAAVEAGGWVGQRGPADRAVMDALLHIAWRCATVLVSASSRQLALSTGLGDSTTARSARRLVEAGWLVVEKPSQGRAAPTYRLQVPPALDLGGALASHPGTPGGVEADGLAPGPLGLLVRGHDAVAAHGLGRYAGLLLELLVDRPSSLGDLAARSGVDIARAEQHLHRLQEEGLLRFDGTRYCALAADTVRTVLDGVADRLGTSGTAEARREEHRRDREHYDLWLADFVAARGYGAERGLRRPGRSTASGAPCPRAVLTRGADGRRSWAEVVALTDAGLGLQDDERQFLTLSGHIDVAHRAYRRRMRGQVERRAAYPPSQGGVGPSAPAGAARRSAVPTCGRSGPARAG
jgi:DNA-binding transcriptional ArsR family regulator